MTMDGAPPIRFRIRLCCGCVSNPTTGYDGAEATKFAHAHFKENKDCDRRARVEFQRFKKALRPKGRK